MFLITFSTHATPGNMTHTSSVIFEQNIWFFYCCADHWYHSAVSPLIIHKTLGYWM